MTSGLLRLYSRKVKKGYFPALALNLNPNLNLRRFQTQPVGLAKPASLQAPLAGPEGKSS
jgi:hypothetical protein